MVIRLMGIIVLAGLIIFAVKQLVPFSPPSSTPTAVSHIITSTPQLNDNQSIKIIASNLDVPWAVDWLPDGRILVTERPGRINMIDKNGQLYSLLTINDVYENGEGGLLGIAVHPNFVQKPFIYIYYTYQGSGSDTLNKVVRYTFKNDQLVNPQVLLDNIPGSSNHNGGRVKFGPDKQLYVTTGDAENPSQAQDKNSFAGKILRMTDEGKPSLGNPFVSDQDKSVYIYSYGHRNPQGLAWDDKGQLWETEHGPSGTETGNDEVNKIIKGHNYGWPAIRGTQSRQGMETPVVESGFLHTWAPSGLTIVSGKLYFSGLKGMSLYEYDPLMHQLTEHLKNSYGRLRESVVGPDGYLYITTSNRDGRGSPQNEDDKIIRINVNTL